MQVKKPPPHLLTAAAEIFRPYCGEAISGPTLLAALRQYQPAPSVPAPRPPPGSLVGIKDAADRLNVSIRQVWRLIKSGTLPAVKLGTRSTRIPEQALVKLSEGGWAE